MIVRLTGEEIAEAITEYLANREMRVQGTGNSFEVRVHLKREGWIKGVLAAIVVDVPIETPPPKQGPYR